MIVIDDILISEDVIRKQFVCDLSACKGECCIAGDYGAPLEINEPDILKAEYPNYADFLTEEGKKVIAKKGFAELDEDDGIYRTPLMKGGPCAYINYDKGIAVCGIEQAYAAGKTAFKKPISCHLYPIRLSTKKEMTYVNYNRWSICKAACAKGKELKVPVYKFLREALIRRFGEDFYKGLEATAAYMEK